jgi:hypothetical protein
MSTNTLAELILEWDNPQQLPAEIHYPVEDVLALSVTWHRLRSTGGDTSMICSILDTNLLPKITEQDRQTAVAIRDYYSKKIMMIKLLGETELSTFRKDLVALISSDGLEIRDSQLGLVYYLPYFYEYDKEVDYVKSQVTCNQQFKEMDLRRTPRKMTLTAELSPIKKLVKKKKSRTSMQYWMKDTSLNAAVLINIPEKNPLLKVWEHHFNNNLVLQIKGVYTRFNMENFEYFCVDDWEIVFG